MEWILSIATILGGISAIWFLYDKRHTIFNCFKLRVSEAVNPLGIPDKDFQFLVAKREELLAGKYLPIDENEEAACRALANNGILVKRMENYQLSATGNRLLRPTNKSTT